MAGIDGGKRNLLDDILPFPEHTTYVEVFCGSAVVLVNKVKSEVEIANDINKRLINAWKQMCKHRRDFVDYCLHEGRLDSQQLFYEFVEEVAEDPVEDAMRFYYINHHSFSQNNTDYHGLSFTGHNHWHEPYLNKLKNLDDIADRLEEVMWISRDFKNVIKRSDKEGVLMYLDPPYFKGGVKYEQMAGREEGAAWTMQDFDDLRSLLADVKKAKFILSIDREDYWFEKMPNLHSTPVERINAASYCVGGTKKRDIEYVIRNFDPDDVVLMDKYKVKDKISTDEIL